MRRAFPHHLRRRGALIERLGNALPHAQHIALGNLHTIEMDLSGRFQPCGARCSGKVFGPNQVVFGGWWFSKVPSDKSWHHDAIEQGQTKLRERWERDFENDRRATLREVNAGPEDTLKQ